MDFGAYSRGLKMNEKIKRIEALFAGATTDGARYAAFNALQFHLIFA